MDGRTAHVARAEVHSPPRACRYSSREVGFEERKNMISKSHARRVAHLLLSLICIVSSSLWAQTASTGALTGTVKDATGAVIVGGTVTVLNTATGQSRTVTTGIDGVFKVPLLPPGTYEVRIASSGFKTVSFPAVTVNVTETPVLNATLSI